MISFKKVCASLALSVSIFMLSNGASATEAQTPIDAPFNKLELPKDFLVAAPFHELKLFVDTSYDNPALDGESLNNNSAQASAPFHGLKLFFNTSSDNPAPDGESLNNNSAPAADFSTNGLIQASGSVAKVEVDLETPSNDLASAGRKLNSNDGGLTNASNDNNELAPDNFAFNCDAPFNELLSKNSNINSFFNSSYCNQFMQKNSLAKSPVRPCKPNFDGKFSIKELEFANFNKFELDKAYKQDEYNCILTHNIVKTGVQELQVQEFSDYLQECRDSYLRNTVKQYPPRPKLSDCFKEIDQKYKFVINSAINNYLDTLSCNEKNYSYSVTTFYNGVVQKKTNVTVRQSSCEPNIQYRETKEITKKFSPKRTGGRTVFDS